MLSVHCSVKAENDRDHFKGPFVLGLALGGARFASWLLAPQLTEGLVLPALGQAPCHRELCEHGQSRLLDFILKTNSELCPHHSQKSEQNAVMLGSTEQKGLCITLCPFWPSCLTFLFLCRSCRIISTAFKTDLQWLLFTFVSILREEVVSKPCSEGWRQSLILCDGPTTLKCDGAHRVSSQQFSFSAWSLCARKE